MSRTKNNVKPETERILAELQEAYLLDHNQEDYHKMFTIMAIYAKSLLLKLLKGKLYLPPETVEEYATNVAIKMMAPYSTNPKYKISSSFAGLIQYKNLEECFGPKVQRNDRVGSLNRHIENGESQATELEDLPESFKFTYLWQSDKSATQGNMHYIVSPKEDAINSCVSVSQDLFNNPDVSLHTAFLVTWALVKKIKGHKSYEKFVDIFMDYQQGVILDHTLLEVYGRLKEAD